MKQKRICTLLLVILIAKSAIADDRLSENVCPCLPIEICPRVLGSEPQDQPFLDKFADCIKPDVRCCGVSSSYYVRLNYDEDLLKTTKETTTNDNIDITTITENPFNVDVYTVLPEVKNFSIKNKLNRIKMENNVSIVYPSEMSGIPQTTPLNMPDNKILMSIDDDTGSKMLLVFSNLDNENISSISPPLAKIINSSSNNETTTPTSITTISESNTSTTLPTTNTSPTTTEPNKLKTKKIKRRRKYNPLKIKPQPILESQKNEASHFTQHVTKSKLAAFYKAKKNQPLKNSPAFILTTEIPIKESEIKTEKPKPDIRHEEYENNRIGRVQLNPKARKILYNPSTRTNFLRRNPIKPHTTPEPVIEIVKENVINSELKSRIDSEHKIMIENLHSALTLKTIKGDETARSIMDPTVNTHILKFENILANKMTEMVNKMIGIKSNLFSEIKEETIKPIIRKTSTSKPNTTYRGSKRFMLPDYLKIDESPKNVLSRSGSRSTTEAPVVTTTARNLRRPSTRRPIQRKFKSHFKAKSSIKKSDITNNENTTITVTKTLTTTDKIEFVTESVSEMIQFTNNTDLAIEIPEIQNITELKTNPEIFTNITELTEMPEEIKKITELTLQSIKNNNLSDQTLQLLADFKPSPLWNLHSEETIIDETPPTYQIRQSRDLFKEPTETYDGFIPVRSSEPLSIVGTIPSGFKTQQTVTGDFGLPPIENSNIKKFNES